ncbi:MAG: hypothetical protein II794_04075 [Oscillospiraceae bacterium]|nr:hypothetical protein [Oscillospiraceae bacterium]
MKVRIAALALVLVMALAFPLSASAAVLVGSAQVRLTFSGSIASCYTVVNDSGKEIAITLELSCGGTVVASWEADGTGRVTISETAAVTPGVTYTLTVSGTVNGAAITPKSVTKTA